MAKILVIVDEQNDFTTGSLGNKECAETIPNVVNVINSDTYDTIYVTRDTHQTDYLSTNEGKHLPVVHCIENTYGWMICNDVFKALIGKPFEMVNKTTFGSIYLANKIREDYFTEQEDVEITICGVCTDICVISNALLLKASMPEATIRVVEKACAGVTPESHNKAIDVMKMCHIDII